MRSNQRVEAADRDRRRPAAERLTPIGSQPVAAPSVNTLAALARAMRPTQWVKNGVVFAALVFGHRLGDPIAIGRTVAAAAVFCLLSSAMYLVNDVGDAERDRLHPVKRRRPVASGALSPRTALTAATVVLAAAAAGAAALGAPFFAVGAAYVGLMIAYSWELKRVAIVDVLAIAIGFVLRAASGALALDVTISPWLLVCTMLLALLLGFGKRRHELATLGNAAAHRRNLDDYTLPMLDQFVAVVAAATVMAYAVYTFDAPNAPNDHRMVLTVPIVLYAIFRYLFLIHARNEGGSPEALLLRDRPLAAAIAVWAAVCVALFYPS
ncbi:MAG TPA: decaprenyl-phosphate phosphoribosyltransferase [Thermomicrobiales bacterium]|nr:decaprenyl-phosphate phosphoribosyltransferase [Thermomicrobiales bacterium]